MAEVQIRDSLGNDAHPGDTIIVGLPAFIFQQTEHDEEDRLMTITKYVHDRILEGRLYLWPSKGLHFKITRIIKDREGFFHIGKILKLKQRAWVWFVKRDEY